MSKSQFCLVDLADNPGGHRLLLTFYVNGVQVGNTVDRVASGDTTFRIGTSGSSASPGHVAVAGVLNTVLDISEITSLHNHMTITKNSK